MTCPIQKSLSQLYCCQWPSLFCLPFILLALWSNSCLFLLYLPGLLFLSLLLLCLFSFTALCSSLVLWLCSCKKENTMKYCCEEDSCEDSLTVYLFTALDVCVCLSLSSYWTDGYQLLLPMVASDQILTRHCLPVTVITVTTVCASSLPRRSSCLFLQVAQGVKTITRHSRCVTTASLFDLAGEKGARRKMLTLKSACCLLIYILCMFTCNKH